MIRFADRSIKVKLMLLFTATAGIALVVACATFWVYETIAYLGTLKRESATIAQMLAENSAAAITFNDASALRETLSGLRAEPRIQQACIYDRRGKILATYNQGSDSDQLPRPSGLQSFRFTTSDFFIHYPVILENDRVGELYIRVGLDELYGRLAKFGGIGLMVLCLATLVVVVISLRWQHLISDPIIHLTQIAGKVSSEGNYSIRAAKTSNDEVGMLIEQFNSMMEQINRRDHELQEAQDKLEMRVQDRTRALQDEIAERKIIEQDLLNAKATAEASNQAKSAFLANMSHELRTPLNAIIGYSEMLQEDAEAASQLGVVSDLGRIQSAGRHLLSLVSDILDLSKIEAGRLEVSMEAVQVSSIVDSVAQTIVPLARKNGNQFSVDTRWNGVVCADPIKLYQCLLNLLSNACKFTEKGAISLTVEAQTSVERDWICWHVKDTGIGIPESGMGKLFQAFSQVDSSATRKHGGTGLGLAISQRLCRLMGGFITVKSTLGVGTTFSIHLPAAGSNARPPNTGKAELVGFVA
jgi:signal transduction histidine kinase